MIKQNPFSVYDFLGYLIPGSLLIYAFLIVKFIKENQVLDLNKFSGQFAELKFENLFVFIIFSYTIGHLLSFISSITIERYANWRYSFPSKYLLNIHHKGYWNSSNNWKDVGWRVLLIFLLFPCVLLDFILGHLLGFKKFYQQSLDVLLQDLILLKTNKLLTKLGISELASYDEGKASEYDFHRILNHYAYENSKQHQSKMSNYVSLYGFLRNLCLIFNLLTVYSLIRIYLFFEFSFENITLLIILSGLTYISFMAFMKFYRRYTLEGFMVIAISEDI